MFKVSLYCSPAPRPHPRPMYRSHFPISLNVSQFLLKIWHFRLCIVVSLDTELFPFEGWSLVFVFIYLIFIYLLTLLDTFSEVYFPHNVQSVMALLRIFVCFYPSWLPRIQINLINQKLYLSHLRQIYFTLYCWMHVWFADCFHSLWSLHYFFFMFNQI